MGKPGSLFLPDILPCPVPGRCEFHAAIFGDGPDSKVPDKWFCVHCQKHHLTALEPWICPQESIWPKICLVSLPTEILQQIAGYLPVSSQASLAFTSRYLCRLIGTSTWINSWAKLNQVANRRKIQFLSHLARDMPAYAHCKECNILRPYDSECAWPLLRNHREERAIRPLVYSISEFLTQRTRMYYRHGRETGTCLSVLTCSGTYHKPWADQDIEDVGFSQEELKQGLPIKYSTTARLAKDLTIDRLITHVNYQINLPQHWSSFSVAQRYAILRDLYLCPHTYASKIQYRDPDDPTYPADSSIAHWLPSRGQIPDSIWRCSQCPTEFRARVGSDSGLVCRFEIDVWQHSTGSCGDGMIEMVHCQLSDWGNRVGRIREMFEAAQPLKPTMMPV